MENREIMVGDRVTGKWLDNKQTMIEIMTTEEMIDSVNKNIKENKIEILKIESPIYEIGYEEKRLLTQEEEEFLREYLKVL